jgi:hypothetical protein
MKNWFALGGSQRKTRSSDGCNRPWNNTNDVTAQKTEQDVWMKLDLNPISKESDLCITQGTRNMFKP